MKRLTKIPEDVCTAVQFQELTRDEIYIWGAVAVSIIAVVVAVALMIVVIRLTKKFPQNDEGTRA